LVGQIILTIAICVEIVIRAGVGLCISYKQLDISELYLIKPETFSI